LTKLRIGLDVDNTLIDYSLAFALAAEKQGLKTKSRNGLRRQLRISEDGERLWQKIQSWVYSEGLEYASLSLGALEVISTWVSQGHHVFLISHKKESQKSKESSAISVRDLSRQFLSSQGLPPQLLGDQSLSYHPTRDSKVERIRSVTLDYFVDDLPEVLEHKLFPTSTVGLLFDPTGEFTNWERRSVKSFPKAAATIDAMTTRANRV